ncbi:hypothetical protein P40_10540 [Alloalcanivorax xenomutans]|jgi:hypothetical protein|nr:hypothetical protein P40_10540 [Alloalcanivorax xenomutans]ERS13076.1 hypothetical protein Q668_01995 [Alcanivorax sp. PN-3]KYZ88039.1 hypothetical protein A3Q32_01090 [Alcanivorax sp. KX64203]PHS66956.1 MAG: hypothetical protein COB00_09755 [Alcanivorax sp.]|tara:strand:+ start:3076 stop:3255 length:180 start_codon:yes stop_codon:yes gene_type:complete
MPLFFVTKLTFMRVSMNMHEWLRTAVTTDRAGMRITFVKIGRPFDESRDDTEYDVQGLD